MSGVLAFLAMIWVSVLLVACSGKESPGYVRSTEERRICHLRYRAGDWRGEDAILPLWLVYRDHIGMHPRDYWGRCRPEDIKPYEQPDDAKPEEKPPTYRGRRGLP